MEERFAPSGRPALARKARFFIWGFAAFCAILVLLAWFLRPNPSAVLWRAQEERSAAQRAYDSRTFVDACNASLQPYGMEIVWADAQWKPSLPTYDLYSRDMAVHTPDKALLFCSLVALSKEQPDANASFAFQKVMLSCILPSDRSTTEIPNEFNTLFQVICDFYEPGLAQHDPAYVASLQESLESCFSLDTYNERFRPCSFTSAECPTVFQLYSKEVNSPMHLLKCVTLHTCPESCQE